MVSLRTAFRYSSISSPVRSTPRSVAIAMRAFRISGASEGDKDALSEIGASATTHGRVLLELGFTVEQVVHDYGDLCQAITDLAVERQAPFSVDQFRTLNRCLDNAIADAVAEFSRVRDETVAMQSVINENLRIGYLVHELRNHLLTATLAFSALESGKLTIGGSTAGLLKRSLARSLRFSRIRFLTSGLVSIPAKRLSAHQGKLLPWRRSSPMRRPRLHCLAITMGRR